MKSEANAELRQRKRSLNITNWQIAESLGVCETTIVRWLRVELEPNKKKQIERAIEQLAKN